MNVWGHWRKGKKKVKIGQTHIFPELQIGQKTWNTASYIVYHGPVFFAGLDSFDPQIQKYTPTRGFGLA